MKRPFSSSRPIGPFIERNNDEVSEFDVVEIQRTIHEDTRYSVAGLIGDSVGLVLDTNSLTIESAGLTDDLYSIAVVGEDEPNNESSNPLLEITAPENETVGLINEGEMVRVVINP